ncbi:MAG TPA: TetR/AcrR family transcriptional regulator [Pseudomonadales bacterium]|jgi:AcrR family transcriptional regulator|nr:TetR/AcrR family transcriptional regulator [Pseudomonadales bacterium]
MISGDIPGVFEAIQKRSVRIRDAYIVAGMEQLNSTRFSDLRISDLAKSCNYSVGSFYTRFEDKEGYFRALRVATISACNIEIDRRVSVETLEQLSLKDALEELVDLMADIFSGQYRGVLRESLLRILEPDDPWELMRQSARQIMANYHQTFAANLPGFTPKQAKKRLSFCFQMIVGVLQNDLVNDYHVFSTRDESLRNALKEIVNSYMGAV